MKTKEPRESSVIFIVNLLHYTSFDYLAHLMALLHHQKFFLLKACGLFALNILLILE